VVYEFLGSSRIAEMAKTMLSDCDYEVSSVLCTGNVILCCLV